MRTKAIMDEGAVLRAIVRIAHEIIERTNGAKNVVLVGVKSRGVPIAERLAEVITAAEGVTLSVGALDIGLYRDDLSLSEIPVIGKTDLGFEVTDKDVVLVDDVLFTGRTVRAAIDALFGLGRPRTIQLAVLIDRGHRELPFRADYVGKNIPTSKNEQVVVRIPPYDDEISVSIETKEI
jgi:Pyrimidine operon attenuation protein/uracil phosphoribosyltransferase